MKFEFEGKNIVAIAENKEESIALFNLQSPVVKKAPVKKHKKHTFKKPCNICGKVCNGIKGLGIHNAAVHGIHSPNYEKNKRMAEVRKEEKRNDIAVDHNRDNQY